ncbi:MAG TPA: PAS domain S-box protein, partial [Spirochaetia bacterium]|nr:PAS domain S-box protein [Spirochaetia bacterium]
HLDAQVRYRTGELLALNERLRKEIAEREHLDAELRASEERLRLAAEATGFGIFSYDLQSRSAHWSAEMLRLFGVPPDGDIVLDAGLVPLAVHPGDRDRVAALVASWTSPGATGIIDTEFRVRWPGGETRWLRARGRVTFESGPRRAAVSAHGIVQDVTVWKLAEENLHEREETYRLLLENSIQGIAILQDGRIVLCNDALCAMNGYSKEEIYAMTPDQVMETVHEPDRPRIEAARHVMESSEEPTPAEVVRFQQKSGEIRWVEVRGGKTLFRGRPALQLSYLDVTDQRRAEEAYRTLVENTAEGYSLFVEGKVEFVNAPLARIIGCTTLELRGMTAEDLSQIIHPDDRARAAEALLRAPAGSSPAEQTFRIQRRDGVWRTLEARSARVEYAGAHAIQTSYRDVTEVLAARQALDETHRKLRNLAAHLLHAREEERRKVAQDVHDDLGQALAAMKIDAHWLRQHVRHEKESVTRKLDDIIGLGEDAIRSVQRISSDLRPRMLDDLGLAPSLDWLAGEFHRRTGLPCRLSVELPPAKIGTDTATSLYRVVQEALSNVARHSRARSADVRLAAENGHVVLSIRDDGVGISPAQASAPDSYGLIGARERIEELGGSLLVEGEPGKGTMLMARIPLPERGGLA